MECVAGCMNYDGGERKHHRDCPHYPESLTKVWHDCEAKYLAEIERLRALIREIDRRVYFEAHGLGSTLAEAIEAVAKGGPCPTVAEAYGDFKEGRSDE